MADYEISIVSRMADIEGKDWDALLGAGGSPLLSHGLLSLLEASASICPETGWTPAHILVRRKGEKRGAPGGLLAAAPFYVRNESWGEFVFDMEFAGIAEKAGIDWYPKLVGMVPATPAPAWEVLAMADPARGGLGRAELQALLLDAAEGAARDSGLAGIHILWPETAMAEGLRARGGWAEWSHQAFLWRDAGYGDFHGWLASFSKNMRRNVSRERETLRVAGVESRILGPEEAASDPAILELMAELYETHNDKFGPWAAKFLTKAFFLRLPEFMPRGWALSAGYEDGKPVALAFLFEGKDRLYGRYYGALREIPNLHFELCYYRPIEYALGRGIGSFDPGMGSPHKARRGFVSSSAPSFHKVFDPRMADFLGRVMPEINREEEAGIASLNEDLPYKKK